MLPISEFHFAFCGIATVAATIGYACARRAALSIPTSNNCSKADVEAGQRTLKRKLDVSDEHDVDADEKQRSMKRNKTPPTDEYQADEDEWEIIVAPPSYEQPSGLRRPHDNENPFQANLADISQNAAPARESTPAANPHPATSSQPDHKGAEVGRCSTLQPPQVDQSPNEPETPPAPSPISHEPAVLSKNKPKKAFSAFSGSRSPFTPYSNTSGTSPFALSGQSVKATPAWRCDNGCDPDGFRRSNFVDALAPSPNDAVQSATTQTPSKSKSDLGVSSELKPFSKSSTHLTGEEEETVDAELKGVKLFIKRGCRDFTDGMYGHVKILTRKSAPQKISSGESQQNEGEINPRSRLLFRRDPLGQVSMNVGLNPTVRCHFEAAENILRVILMEQVTAEGKSTKEDIIIYALKPGRSGKANFESFAKMLCNREELGPRVAKDSAAAGDATAR